MYDNKQTEIKDKAMALIVGIRRELANGTKHYRKSDGKLLKTDVEIIKTLINEGDIEFQPKPILIQLTEGEAQDIEKVFDKI